MHTIPKTDTDTAEALGAARNFTEVAIAHVSGDRVDVELAREMIDAARAKLSAAESLLVARSAREIRRPLSATETHLERGLDV